MSKNTYKKLRIFVASPGDVAAEKTRLQVVISDLELLANKVGLVLELVDWNRVVPDVGRPQAVIFNQLKPKSWDVFIGILWNRFGTKPGASNPLTNLEYFSGTEEEFCAAYDLWKKDGRPRILLYHSSRPVDSTQLDLDQLKLVRNFLSKFSADAEHPGLYQTYDSLDSFGRRLQKDITQIILEHGNDIPHEIVEAIIPTIPDTLPRRGTFFGRKDQIDFALRSLNSEVRGWGLVIDGIGGIGKTSLATEVAYLCRDRDIFDAFIFVTAKRDRLETSGITEITLSETTLDGIISETARALGQPGIAQLTGGKNKQKELLDALRTKKALIIFDNLETLTLSEQNAIGDFLLNLPQNCKAIVTTRQHSFTSALTLRLNKLKWEEAKEIIENQIKQFEADLIILQKIGEQGWKKLYDEAGGSPLALIYIIGLMRVRRLSFERTIELLRDGTAKNNLVEFIYREARRTMDENERTVLNTISLFGGMATFEAISSIADLNRHALDSVLERLRALGLVDIANVETGQDIIIDQYTLHPLTKRFAQADLAENKKLEFNMRVRYSRYWSTYSKKFSGSIRDASKNYDKLELEWDNLNAAIKLLKNIACSDDDSVKDKKVGRMLTNFIEELNLFLWAFGRWDEICLFNAWAYVIACSLGNWRNAGWFAYFVARINYYRACTKESAIWTDKCTEAWSRKGSSIIDQAYALKLRGLLSLQRGDYKLAKKFLTEAVGFWEKSSDDYGVATGYNDLGVIARENMKYSEAKQYYQKALKLAETLDMVHAKIYIPINMGVLLLDGKQWALASRRFKTALKLAEEDGSLDLIAQAQYGLSRALYAQGDFEKARSACKESVILYKRIQHTDLPKAEQFFAKINRKN
ncbi:MAG: tetratricopeptide repeat protein [Ginsengibacter sp.]